MCIGFAVSAMRNENTATKLPKTVGRRKKLTDITNTPILQKSRAYDELDHLSTESSDCVRHELENLKKTLAEKEQYIEECKRCMDKLWVNYCRKTKQNDEVILHNSQLFKDLSQARDKLKVLEHENAQMAALYKICKSEMQEKLNEAQEQVDHLTKLLEVSKSEKAPADDNHSPVDSDISEKHGLSCEAPGEDDLNIHGMSTLRKKQRKSYKEPSLKQKIRQTDGNIVCSQEPIECDNDAVVQKLCRDKEGKALPTDCITETEMSQGMACLHTVYGNGACAEALPLFTVRKNVRKDQGAQLFEEATQKSFGRPRRRTASCVGSYKEPPLNTKMRRQPD